MTKAEAIEKLREFCKLRTFCELYPDACQKDNCEIYMAIEALEKQARLEELMNMGTEYADRMYKEGNADDKTGID